MFFIKILLSILLVLGTLLSVIGLIGCQENGTLSDETNDITDTLIESTEVETTIETMDSNAEKVEYFRKKASNFKTAAFGSAVSEFSSPYDAPFVYPVKGQHPRVMISSSYNLEEIRDNLTADSNKGAAYKYMSLSNKVITGGYKGGGYSVVFELLNAIESKAFRYLVTGDMQYGYQAIYNIKNAILTMSDKDIGEPYRTYGLTMYVAGCVYDWCYDLLTDADKEQIINGVLNKLGARMEVGCPPSKVGAIAHHTVEGQILRDYFAFAIAVYDERPDVYEYVAGRLCNEIAPAQNYMLAGGRHWEGSFYGPFRLVNLLDAQSLMLGMTNGDVGMFDVDSLYTVSSALMDFTLPGIDFSKNHVFEVGDIEHGSFLDYYAACFMASSLFDDAALKGFSSKFYNGNFVFDSCNNNYISPVRYLILNEPEVEPTDPFADRALVNITEFPSSAIFARNSWNDKDAVAVYMTMPEFYSASHSHAEAGSFQIYYKGMLASDSGYYGGEAHGTGHHAAYTRQTIASNSLLVYNPALLTKGSYRAHVYSGGQSLVKDKTRITTPYTLESLLSSASLNQVTLIGKAADESNGVYKFSYLAGDMTNAYDDETVDEVTRHMLSVMTDNEEFPMVFVTFDRITADDPSFKKTFLLHGPQNPEVTDEGYVIITNTKDSNSGKLVAQSLITDMTCTVYGDGNGAEYTVNGEVYKTSNYDPNDPDYRIELSPTYESKTDHLLTVMYVTDASNNAAPIKAEEIQTAHLAGAVILNRVMLFAKNPGTLDTELSVVVNGEGEFDYYFAGVAAGTWNVSVNGKTVETVEVAAGEGILTFTASAGNVTVTPA